MVSRAFGSCIILSTDILFFTSHSAILFASEQLKLNPESFNLHFLGDIKKDNPLYNIVYKYIRNVHVENKVTNYKIAKNIENITSNFVILNSF